MQAIDVVYGETRGKLYYMYTGGSYEFIIGNKMVLPTITGNHDKVKQAIARVVEKVLTGDLPQGEELDLAVLFNFNGVEHDVNDQLIIELEGNDLELDEEVVYIQAPCKYGDEEGETLLIAMTELEVESLVAGEEVGLSLTPVNNVTFAENITYEDEGIIQLDSVVTLRKTESTEVDEESDEYKDYVERMALFEGFSVSGVQGVKTVGKQRIAR